MTSAPTTSTATALGKPALIFASSRPTRACHRGRKATGENHAAPRTTRIAAATMIAQILIEMSCIVPSPNDFSAAARKAARFEGWHPAVAGATPLTQRLTRPRRWIAMAYVLKSLEELGRKNAQVNSARRRDQRCALRRVGLCRSKRQRDDRDDPRTARSGSDDRG